jgi:hypothetical protein
MVTQVISPPSPSGNFGARTCGFSEKPEDLWRKWQVVEKVVDLRQTRRSRVLGGPWWIYPKPAVFLIILKLRILI